VKTFKDFFLTEYRHNLADGTPRPSTYVDNKMGNNPFGDLQRAKGPYEVEIKLGQHFIGPEQLGAILQKLFQSTDSLSNFENGKILKHKTTGLGLQCYLHNNQPTMPSAVVVKVN